MSEEKRFKEEGEELAKVAVRSGMGSKQLQTIYRMVKTKKPLPFVEAFVQRQIARAMDGTVHGREGFEGIHQVLKRYGDDRTAVEKVLMYAAMLYDYYEKVQTFEDKGALEEIVRKVVEGKDLKYGGLKISQQGDVVVLNVSVVGFHDNPRTLASEIERELVAAGALSGRRRRVWIESVLR
ncbi:MAG: hypothetical protein ACP5KV_06950, partial [Candidatus Methanomethylicaceae archaeon]